MKNREFDGLLDKAQVLRVLNIENISSLENDADSILEEFSDLKASAKSVSDQAGGILSRHLALLTEWKSFKAWCGELEQSLMSVSDFSGDRYTLMARFDRLSVSLDFSQKLNQL